MSVDVTEQGRRSRVSLQRYDKTRRYVFVKLFVGSYVAEDELHFTEQSVGSCRTEIGSLTEIRKVR